MILVIDCGNSAIKWGRNGNGHQNKLQATGSAVHIGRIDAALAELADSMPAAADRVIVSNVAGPVLASGITKVAAERLGKTPEFVNVQAEAHGVRCGYVQLGDFGVDRWVGLIAGRQSANVPVAVINAGTAVTFDALDASGQHLGGLILASPRLMAAELNHRTDQIGAIELPRQAAKGIALLGKTTADGVGNGSMLAVAAALDRAISVIAKALGGQPRAILTGGGALSIRPWLETEVQFEANLVLDGLVLIARDSGSRRA